ncbi:hypothetical protein ACTMU2_16965 [Cupriavidus basilensis]
MRCRPAGLVLGRGASAAGAAIVDAASLWASVDVVIEVRPPQVHPGLGVEEAALIKKHAALISFVWPAQQMALLERLSAAWRDGARHGLRAAHLARAEARRASSMANGRSRYRAVIEAAHAFGRPFAGQITAAGKIPPARVLVIGAGVAGLAAIGAARSLGAVVCLRHAARGAPSRSKACAEFLTVEIEEDGGGSGGYAKEMSPAFIEAEMKLFAEQAREVDIIITTALIPGKPAPRFAGSRDGRADASRQRGGGPGGRTGGNCVLTVPARWRTSTA